MSATCSCSRPISDDAYLCVPCTNRLAQDLGEAGALDEELTTTRLRQSKTGGAASGVLSRSYDRPLAWDQKAAEIQDALRATTVGWVRVVLEERGGPMPTDALPDMARWLLARLEYLRHHPDAEEIADEFHDATTRAWEIIDRATAKSYAGPCREEVPETEDHGPVCCVAELHAREGARTVICKECQARHDAAARREWLLLVAANQLVPAADLPSILGTPEKPLSPNTVKSWIKRGRLVAHGKEPALYRVGDAVDLVYPRKATA